MMATAYRGAKSPLGLLTISALSVFLAEFIIMAAFNSATEMSPSPLVMAIADSSILILVIGPILYFLSYRPLNKKIYELKLANIEITHQKLHDTFTGLPNHILLNDRLEHAIQVEHREGKSLVFISIRLHQVEELRSAVGLTVTDKVTLEAVSRLFKTFRESDTVGRISTSDFGVVLPGVDLDHAILAVRKTLDAFNKPILLDGTPIALNVSAGIAIYPEHGQTADDLMRRAKIALDSSEHEIDRFVIYNTDEDVHAARRLVVFGALRRAIADSRLMVQYQPKVHTDNGTLHSVEALLRWTDAEHGAISPGEFIPLAENTGLIRSLCIYMLEEVFQQRSIWLEAGHDIKICMNLSPLNLMDSHIMDHLGACLEKYSLSSSGFRVEVTESMDLSGNNRVSRGLRALREMGFETAIDDFGTGYSSFSHLTMNPAEELKIDQSFVREMLSKDLFASVVRSSIDLAHNLDMEVVAEGVEDDATLSRLKDLGCDFAQGYFISRPMDADGLTHWMQKRAAG